MGVASLLVIIGFAIAAVGHRRLRRLEDEVAWLRSQLEAAPHTLAAREDSELVAPPMEQPAYVAEAALPPLAPDVPAYPAEPVTPRRTVEALIGGQLPIWVGGAALVIAAFFLVRYSIESGLLGPGVRVLLAALFSAALIAASELVRRLAITRDDPRIGQVLAGAGVASAYGTLYVAAAQYHLIGALGGFALMIVITAGSLALSLRHGPPTAIMALVGGFAAPLVAGFDAAGVGALLVYLALLIAALFVLAAQRGWAWLAIAAVVAGFGWANLLVALLDGRELSGVAAFVVALAIGATLALPRTGASLRWLRVAPLVAGLLQLLIVAPGLDFGPIAWIFHLTLAGTALELARRDSALEPAAVAAAWLVTALVAAGLIAPEEVTTPIAAVAATILLGGVGFMLSRRSPAWAQVALVGIAGPVLVAHVIAPQLLPRPIWSLLEIALAGATATMAWRHRDRVDRRDIGLVGGSAIAALLLAVAVGTMASGDWRAAALAIVLLLLGEWAQRVHDRDVDRLPALLLVAIAMIAAAPIGQWLAMIGASLAGARLTYVLLPTIGTTLQAIGLPTLAAAALCFRPRGFGTARRFVVIGLVIAATLIAFTLAKQPLAIADGAGFARFGFVERAAITLAFAAIGFALAHRTATAAIGRGLLLLALARFVIFDLVLLDPVVVDQSVGPLPILNAAVMLPAGLALAVWFGERSTFARRAAFALVAVAVGAAVRQAAHGDRLTGPLGSGETWGYSAAYLALASVWLWRGLVAGQRDLRIAALALLTLVTIKVFLIDVAALGGVLRILSFLGLGLALIGIGWAYNRLIARAPAPPPPSSAEPVMVGEPVER